MDPFLKLDTAVGLLVRRSHHRVVDEDGNARFVVADPLLVQLRMAAAGSMSGSGVGGGSGKPIPINSDAYDLLEKIREEVTTQWWYSYGIHRGAGSGTLGGELLAWVQVSKTDAGLAALAANITTRWVMEIRTLFNPNLRRPFPGACKKCGESRTLDREEDGERFYKPAMVKLYDEDGTLLNVECGACGGSWTGDQLQELAK